MAMRNDFLKSVLIKNVKDDPVMREFLEAIYGDDEARASMRYKGFYNRKIEEALKKREAMGDVPV